ncbi:MAG: hypothetical protein ACKVVP_01080 [Chloroflexota bacterium]
MRRLPTYQAGTSILVRAFFAALGAGIIGNILIDVVRGFGFILTILLGLLIAEAVGWATNRRRGPYLGWTAAAGTVIGMVLGRGVLTYVVLGAFTPELRIQASFAAMASIGLMSWIMILAAAGIAYYRLRL